jgi:hypothetical protein
MNRLLIGLAALTTLGSTAVLADSASRIHGGIRDGSLTRYEARGLIQEEQRIRQFERMALRDGHLDSRERAQLAHMKAEHSRHIYMERHDRQVRGVRWW